MERMINQQQAHSSQKPPRNYKLLVDPFLVKGSAKLYRYDGNITGDPTYPLVTPRDPRSHLTRIWTRLETLDLPVPRYKHYLITVVLSQTLTNHSFINIFLRKYAKHTHHSSDFTTEML